MKHIFISLCTFLLTVTCAVAKELPELRFTPGSELTLINKLMETPRRYARVDTVKYDGFTDFQRRELVQHSAGLALVFETNSDCIYANIDYIKKGNVANAPSISVAGLDLYIKSGDGRWLYAGNNVPRKDPAETFELVTNLAPGNKECLLYLPYYSIVNEVNIGVSPDSYLRPIENPFKGRVVFWGSSFTHGVSTSRAGMAYPLQLERATGLHIPVLGVSGNAKLQQSFARVLADTPADAFVFDAFSNPSVAEIEHNFDAFLATIRASHPTTPIIFMQTIYRDNRNFNTVSDNAEAKRIEVARQKVMDAMETDSHLYYIVPDAGGDIDTTCDGIHPSDFGYYMWMQSIKDPILTILRNEQVVN